MFRWSVALCGAVISLLLGSLSVGAITDGQPDGDRHPAVGVVFNVEGFCSGTLIAPTVVLTAGHCTDFFEGTTTYVSFDAELQLNPDITQPVFPTEHAIVASDVLTHPDFCIGCARGLPGFDTYDVGLIILSQPVTGVDYGTLPNAEVVDSLKKGTRLTAVGYGTRDFTRGGGPRQPEGFGLRSVATVSFITVRNRIGDMFIKQSSNKGGVCYGDSGGPIFAPDQTTILGVTAFGASWVCTSVGYAQRIDRPDVLEWITAYLPTT